MAEVKNEFSVDVSAGVTNSTSSEVNGTSGANGKKFKGIKVNCGELRKYLYGVEIYRQASMLRKGREVHKIYVDVHKGVSFLDDRFTLTDFGKMVLENGSVRAGRARNVQQIVVARETLYCSGTGGCKRACGGYGSCILGCDKIKVRGHKCSFRVKLTMRLGFVDHWFVEILGSHNCYIEDGEPPSDVDKMLEGYEPKSSDGEDSTCNSQRASPFADTTAMMTVSQNGASFLPPTSSPPAHPSMLLTSAHCHLNVPLFPESYLMSVARNAAAAVAMTNGGGQARRQPSPLSLSLKRNRSSPDMLVPEIINGLLPPSVIPQFGPIPVSSCSPPTGDNGHSPNTPPTDAMDLSTPKVSIEDEPRVLSVNSFTAAGAAALKYSTPIHSNGYSNTKTKTSGSTKGKNLSEKDNFSARSSFSDNIPDYSIVLPSGPPKSVFNPIPSRSLSSKSSMTFLSPINFSSATSANPRYLKGNVKRLHYSHHNAALLQQSLIRSENEGGGEEEEEGKKPSERENDSFDSEEGLDKDLINRVQQLEAHVTQLRNIVLKQDGGTKAGGQDRRKQQREFDFTKYNTRHVALKIAYLGWDYHGYVVQEDTDKTIEAALFETLLKTRLIEARETSNYHRCGRTDKGVSALGQVISIDLRTNLLTGVGVKIREGGTAHTRQGDTTTEIRYVHILNKVLPPEIRVLAWAPVDTEFSARFSCKKRTYKYYFPKGNLNIQKMNEAAAKLVGEHDFRNLCKMDVGNGVVNFMRKILRADITVLNESEHGYSICELTVVGQAFLWHQIRCIVSILFLIGQSKEEITILDELLNVDKNPRKPQYTMASELPLVLFDCDFGDNLEWIYEADWHEDNIRHLQQIWAQHTIKATVLKCMLEELDVAKVETESDIAPWNELSAPLLQQSDWLIPGNKPRVHKPLLKRQMCESLEERIEYYTKRKKLTDKESCDGNSSEAAG